MWSVLLKLEGKSIVQQSVFMYCSRSCKTSNWGNKCDEEFDGQCLRCKTTCTHFPRKRSDSAWLMQSTLTLQKIFRKETALIAALYLLAHHHGKQIRCTNLHTCKNLKDEDEIQSGGRYVCGNAALRLKWLADSDWSKGDFIISVLKELWQNSSKLQFRKHIVKLVSSCNSEHEVSSCVKM